MMNACEYHANAVNTPERAMTQAGFILNDSRFSVEMVAEFISRLHQFTDACCPRAYYARELMAAACRELLLPNGWFDGPALSERDWLDDSARCLLDVPSPATAWEWADAEWYGLGYDEYNEWPSEDQLISWNEANDYLHEGDES